MDLCIQTAFSGAILSILGDCWEKFICFSPEWKRPDREIEWKRPGGRVLSGQQGEPTLLQPDLLGSFPADVCPDITGQFSLGVVIGQNSPLQWGKEGKVSAE